jgi:hypothetical protein
MKIIDLKVTTNKKGYLGRKAFLSHSRVGSPLDMQIEALSGCDVHFGTDEPSRAVLNADIFLFPVEYLVIRFFRSWVPESLANVLFRQMSTELYLT